MRRNRIVSVLVAVFTPGEGFAEGHATTHWAENTGKVPAVWIAVDIPKP